MWYVETTIGLYSAIKNSECENYYVVAGPILTNDDSDQFHHYVTCQQIVSYLNNESERPSWMDDYFRLTKTTLCDRFSGYISAYGTNMSEENIEQRNKMIDILC